MRSEWCMDLATCKERTAQEAKWANLIPWLWQNRPVLLTYSTQKWYIWLACTLSTCCEQIPQPKMADTTGLSSSRTGFDDTAPSSVHLPTRLIHRRLLLWASRCFTNRWWSPAPLRVQAWLPHPTCWYLQFPRLRHFAVLHWHSSSNEQSATLLLLAFRRPLVVQFPEQRSSSFTAGQHSAQKSTITDCWNLSLSEKVPNPIPSGRSCYDLKPLGIFSCYPVPDVHYQNLSIQYLSSAFQFSDHQAFSWSFWADWADRLGFAPIRKSSAGTALSPGWCMYLLVPGELVLGFDVRSWLIWRKFYKSKFIMSL